MLLETLNTIEREAGNYKDSFLLVDSLLNEYGEENLAERLYSDIDKSISWRTIASLFSILQWSTSDNGAALTKEINLWLSDANDLRKIKIALNLDTYPFSTMVEMKEALTKIIKLYPEVSEKCKFFLTTRKTD